MKKVSAAVILACLVVGFGLLIMDKNASALSGQPPPFGRSPAGREIKNRTLAEVAEHNSSSSCWAGINDKVYDLTNWIQGHPGGPDKILSICGRDASELFNAQHDSQDGPINVLTAFYIGDLNP